MKTKVLLMCAIVALTVYSCSTERDEENKEIPVEVKKPELEKLKSNNPNGTQNRIESDTTFTAPILPLNSPADPDFGTDPTPDPNDPELIPPGDIRPPKGGK